jgi:hypothetical protein
MKKRRKPNQAQHLPKVGTRDEAAYEQHLERQAVADTMGLGNAPGWLKWGCLHIGALILIGAVISLIALD